MDKLENEIQQIHSNESAKRIQKVFRGSKARRETEQMKNEIIQNEQADEENTDEPDENKSVTKIKKVKAYK